MIKSDKNEKMCWWTCKLIFTVTYHGFIFCCIPNQNLAGKPLKPGTRWVEGPWSSGLGMMRMFEDKVEEDNQVPAAVRTMTELRKMADSIHPMIQLEEDHCHNHQDQKLPILDLKVWVVEVEEREEKRAKLRWQYYRKYDYECKW